METVKQQLRQWRENDAKFALIFEAAQALRGNEEIAMPRVSVIRRQQNRASPDVSCALDYFSDTGVHLQVLVRLSTHCGRCG